MKTRGLIGELDLWLYRRLKTIPLYDKRVPFKKVDDVLVINVDDIIFYYRQEKGNIPFPFIMTQHNNGVHDIKLDYNKIFEFLLEHLKPILIDNRVKDFLFLADYTFAPYTYVGEANNYHFTGKSFKK